MTVFSESDWIAFAKGTDAKRSAVDEVRSSLGALQSMGALEPDSFAAGLAESFVWMDYFSIPQNDSEAQLRAIHSIPLYVERSTYFMVCAPRAIHASTGEACDFSTWQGRGWCRLEEWSNLLSQHAMSPIVISEREKVCVLETTDVLLFRAHHKKCAVGCGAFSCVHR